MQPRLDEYAQADGRPADERGSGNHMKSESVLRATRLIRTGEVIELSHVLSASMPFFGASVYDKPEVKAHLESATRSLDSKAAPAAVGDASSGPGGSPGAPRSSC